MGVVNCLAHLACGRGRRTPGVPVGQLTRAEVARHLHRLGGHQLHDVQVRRVPRAAERLNRRTYGVSLHCLKALVWQVQVQMQAQMQHHIALP